MEVHHDASRPLIRLRVDAPGHEDAEPAAAGRARVDGDLEQVLVAREDDGQAEEVDGASERGADCKQR